jgi:hypothetical protein
MERIILAVVSDNILEVFFAEIFVKSLIGEVFFLFTNLIRLNTPNLTVVYR